MSSWTFVTSWTYISNNNKGCSLPSLLFFRFSFWALTYALLGIKEYRILCSHNNKRLFIKGKSVWSYVLFQLPPLPPPPPFTPPPFSVNGSLHKWLFAALADYPNHPNCYVSNCRTPFPFNIEPLIIGSYIKSHKPLAVRYLPPRVCCGFYKLYMGGKNANPCNNENGKLVIFYLFGPNRLLAGTGTLLSANGHNILHILPSSIIFIII